jgi:4a-hydroxytetrahydrobiopterin dehydratase
VVVSLRTKKIMGLHENDFIIAAKLDRLADDTSEPTARRAG